MTLRRHAPLVLAPLAFLSILLAPASGNAANPDTVDAAPLDPQIWGGQSAATCAWPTAVRVTGSSSLCTGTLIHPQVVMYAAHCGGGNKTIRFGESQNSGDNRSVQYCRTKSPWSDQGDDWAYCVLSQPIDLPITPVAFGCELDQYYFSGQEVAVVGFGNNDGMSGSGLKRWGFTTMTALLPDRFNVGGSGSATVCSGDSGGPAYVRYEDGTWHTFGIASTKNASTCNQAQGTYSLASNAAVWIEQDSGIDVTPCHDAETGAWQPGPLCGEFFNGQPALSYGSWYTGCQDLTASGWSETCGPGFDVQSESNPPLVAIFSPSDGEAFPDSSVTLDIEIANSDDSPYGVAVQIEIDGALQDKVIEGDPALFEDVAFPQGEFTLVAHATDYWGNVATSKPVTIVVGETDAPEPTNQDDEDDGGDEGDTGGIVPAADDGGSGGCAVAAGSARGPLGSQWFGLALLGLGLGFGLRRRA